MKTLYSAIFCLLAVVFVSSCTDKYSEELMMNVPVYLDYSTLRSSVHQTQARELVHPGKIYFKGNYLLVVENREGVHVIDVSNPANPQNKVFVEIPGCIDIAVKDNSLYADSYVDLVTIDISDISNPKESGRIKDIFPYSIPVAGNMKLPYGQVEQEKGVVIRWDEKREKREIEQVYYPSYPPYPMYDDKLSMDNVYSGGTRGYASTASLGIGGSMARFGLYDKYLYVAGNYILYLFDVQHADSPINAGTQNLSEAVETMFIYDGNLFFGTPNGMSVYSLKIPSMPIRIGSFWHTTSCDPVVIQDGYAYITLRSGSNCNSTNVNRLDVVKLSSDYKQYELINSYGMKEPYGLGIDGNVLFVCDGSAGLKVYDVTDKRTINSHLLAVFPGIKAYDVIPVGNYLFMVGDDGFYLYDYSDIKNIKKIGQIPVVSDKK
jgi:hypothetical protein